MGNNSNAGVTLAIFTFYIFIIILMGLINTSMSDSTISTSLSADQLTGSATGIAEGDFGFFDFVSAAFNVFVSGITFSLTGIPIWASIILFLPLGITIIYLVAELLATAVP